MLYLILLFTQWNNDYIFLIMEYCSGGDLSRFIRGKRLLPEEIARRFLRQLGVLLLIIKMIRESLI